MGDLSQCAQPIAPPATLLRKAIVISQAPTKKPGIAGLSLSIIHSQLSIVIPPSPTWPSSSADPHPSHAAPPRGS